MKRIGQFTLLIFLFACNDSLNYHELYERAKIESDKENYEDAIEYLNESIGLNPEFDSAYAEIGHCYYMINQLDSALVKANKSLKMNRRNYSFRFTRGLIRKAKYMSEESLEDFNFIINRADSVYLTPALKERADLFYNLDDIKYSIEDWSTLINLDENNPEYYAMRGICHSEYNLYHHVKDSLNRIGKAIDEAFILSSRYRISYIYNDPILYEFLNIIDSDRALNDFDRAIKVDQNYSFAYLAKASLLTSNNKLLLAIDEINQAISIEENSEYYEFRGIIYKKLGYYEDAMNDFDKALELDRSNTTVYQNIEYLLDEQSSKK